ncbi:MAG: heavy metal-responsive transcriptional regulator [Gemmatimonadaceae bacterium]
MATEHASDSPLAQAGEVAKRLGIGVPTLHFYEREKLIPPPPRSAGGFRLYSPNLIRRVEFIRKAQSLGLPLEEIREILELSLHGGCPCGRVEAGLKRQLADVDQRIAELTGFRGELSDLLKAAHISRPIEGGVAICAIVEDAPEVAPIRRGANPRRSGRGRRAMNVRMAPT